MAAIAAICVAAGTWQISRYQENARENRALSGNAHAAAARLTTALVPLVGDGPAPAREAVRYRTVTASGIYVVGSQQYLRDQTLKDASGYYVLDLLRTSSAALLVVRGFVADTGSDRPPTGVPDPPTGSVLISGRLQTPSSKADGSARLVDQQISSINPASQAARFGQPVYDAYLTLLAGQPGSTGVTPLPEPDLSNPAGGAVGPQHLAYVVQWYLFALLALAAPFVMGRSEIRDARRRFLGIDADAGEFGAIAGDPNPEPLALGAGGGPVGGGELAARARATVAERSELAARQWQRAVRLADRYGRSLGVDADGPPTGVAMSGPIGLGADFDQRYELAKSAERPYRSQDPHHAAYNDYLWQLALADGAVPQVSVPPTDEGEIRELREIHEADSPPAPPDATP